MTTMTAEGTKYRYLADGAFVFADLGKQDSNICSGKGVSRILSIEIGRPFPRQAYLIESGKDTTISIVQSR